MRSSRLAIASLLCLCFMVGGGMAPTGGMANAGATPTLTLEPNQAPCGSTITARGGGFPPGRTVDLAFAGPTKPPPPGSVPIPMATVGADGSFVLDIVPCDPTTPGVDQEGTQFTVVASTPTTDPFLPPEAYASAVYTVGPIGQRPIPALTLTPESGACNGPVVASGANWFPGDLLSFTAFPVGSHQGVGFAEVTVGADGTFSLAFDMHRATLCSAPFSPPIGTQYRIGGGPYLKGNSPRRDSATAIYTITQERQTERCFVETGQCVRGKFFERWERHGLAGNGYPLTGEIRQTLEDGNEHTVQYFERVRMEQHPENAPPHDILLGQFGRRILAGVPGAPTAPVAPVAQEPGGDYFPQTGHNVDARFMAYWLLNGQLAQFGFPLTEAFDQQLEDGKVYRVQYFERARFEYHPEHAGTPYEVLLGQFGRQILAESGAAGR
jgi:hypothetical protein